jgi:hypothetical protein
MSCNIATRLSLIVAVLLASNPASPQTPASPAGTPVGHWVAEHTSQGGIGSWWDFRPDGTLTMHIGAAVTSTITRSGDTITSPSVTTTGPPLQVKFHVDGDTLHLTSLPDNQERIFNRVGSAPSSTDPLLGKWKPIPPATHSTNPNIAIQEKVMANGLLVFAADNTESVRIPFTSFEGTWDATTHTMHVQNQPGSFTYQRTGAKLSLGQPSNNQQTDTYIPDPIL